MTVRQHYHKTKCVIEHFSGTAATHFLGLYLNLLSFVDATHRTFFKISSFHRQYTACITRFSVIHVYVYCHCSTVHYLLLAGVSTFLVADTQLYKRLCPSVRPLVGRSVTTSRKVRKRAFPPLPTHPQLMAVYPALFFSISNKILTVLKIV